MSAAFLKANIKAKKVLASLKSGVPLQGTVRSHATDGSTDIAWIGIHLPALGARQVVVRDEPNLQPGQKVVLQCLPDPVNPEHYLFHLASAPQPRPHRQRKH